MCVAYIRIHDPNIFFKIGTVEEVVRVSLIWNWICNLVVSFKLWYIYEYFKFVIYLNICRVFHNGYII